MQLSQRITPWRWFESQAEDDGQLLRVGLQELEDRWIVSRYSDAGQRTPTNARVGSVMTVAFEIDGQSFTALNGGPIFTFNEAVSLQVNCKDQQEIDDYWGKLSKASATPTHSNAAG